MTVIPGGVTPKRQSREEDQFSVTTPDPAYLVLANPVYPGWKATVDGKRISLSTISGELPAIKLTPGTHTIVYRYAPTTVYLGAIISGIGVLLLLAGFFVGWFYQRGWRPSRR